MINRRRLAGVRPAERRRLVARGAMLTLSTVAMLVAAGCQSMYYGALESFGVHKREVLVDRVEDTRDAQEDAKEQFASALDQFRSVVNVDGGELEAKYDTLKAAYERSDDRAKRVRDRIESVEDVADALFREWERELAQYSDARLARLSEQQLRETQARYRQLLSAMHTAEAKMAPVLSAFNDRVLFLKHNLNARAIASLQGEVDALEDDIASLIAEMEASINEANQFIDQMQSIG